uniref:Uncharacterized protein n=1 Tax=Globodera rostochiensis TaxID=31243 RepID=A0A914H4V1_GLORO
MNDLNCFYSAKMVFVFILMLSLATLEAQRNENDKFFDLMTAIGEHLGGEFNDTEKALELDLNEYVQKDVEENCKKFENEEAKIIFLNNVHYELAINFEFNQRKDIYDRANDLLSDWVGNDVTMLRLNLLPLSEEAYLKKNALQMLRFALMNNLCFFYLAKMVVVFILMLSLATLEAQRNENDKFFDLMTAIGEHLGGEFNDTEKALEALVHGKNIDGTLKEKEENPKDKIQTFLAVPKCFQESELKIFDYWIEIIEMKTKNSQKPIFGVAIYKEKYGLNKSEDSKEKAFRLSRENYKILKHENEEAQIIFLNNVHHELAINFEYNQRKDIYGRAKKLLSDWRGHLSEELYLEKNASQILHKIKNLTSEKKHRESISIIEALIGNEHFNQFNLGALFDEIKWLVEVAIPEEEANIAEKMKKKNTKQLENDIKFMKPNLKEQARTLAKTFEKMLQNVKEHYAQKMDE